MAETSKAGPGRGERRDGVKVTPTKHSTDGSYGTSHKKKPEKTLRGSEELPRRAKKKTGKKKN